MLISQIVGYYWVDLLGKAFSHKASSWRLPPLFFAPQELHRPTLLDTAIHKLILYNLPNSQKCKMSRQIKDNIIKDNINSFNTNNIIISVPDKYAAAKEKSKILAWLSPLEPRRRHHDIRSSRVRGVGDWLLQTRKYQNWFGGIRGGKSNGSALFCYGGPGVGKTHIR